jgi:hypothetical protein
MFPGLVSSKVTLTNENGVYSHSLAEYALTCCNWLAKDLPRMRAAHNCGGWVPFEVAELRDMYCWLSLCLSQAAKRFCAVTQGVLGMIS